jgi:hypothetical protein
MFDGETDEPEDPTEAARRAIFGALDGSTLAEVEAEQAASEAQQDDDQQ